jgi:hypothetical protein
MSGIASIKSIIYAKGYNRQEWINLINICNSNKEEYNKKIYYIIVVLNH